MIEESITWGETYELEIEALDFAGEPIAINENWQIASRFTRGRVGGQVVAEPELTVASGKPRLSIDTGDDAWKPGIYYYDIRLTNPEGDDQWTSPVKLNLATRNTPNT